MCGAISAHKQDNPQEGKSDHVIALSQSKNFLISGIMTISQALMFSEAMSGVTMNELGHEWDSHLNRSIS